MRQALYVFLLCGAGAVCAQNDVDEDGSTAAEQADFIKWGPASKELGGQASVQWLSQYFFRGLRFSHNDVLQQEIGVWYAGFKARGFFSYDCNPDEYSEADFTGSYSYALNESTAVEAGYTFYGYPHRMYGKDKKDRQGYDIKDTQEIFAGVMGVTDYLGASVYGYYDFRDGTGALWEFALGKSLDIDHFKPVTLKPYVRASANLNCRYFNDATEFSHSILTVGLPLHLTDHAVLSGSLNYQWGWQGWVEDDWYAQVGVTLRF
ncbi:MAG TPA: hypothetical protein DCM87_04255 [Planctomycetes bacterium]|nr:hypothetical protein [Planctomycetota bacterium]